MMMNRIKIKIIAISSFAVEKSFKLNKKAGIQLRHFYSQIFFLSQLVQIIVIRKLLMYIVEVS